MDVSIGAPVSAAPPPDASCASAESHAGAEGLFAALLDEAAGGSGQSASARKADKADEDDFDELAASTMPSLLCLGFLDPVSDAPAEGDAVSGTGTSDGTAVTEETIQVGIVAANLQGQTAATIGDDIGAAATEGAASADAGEADAIAEAAAAQVGHDVSDVPDTKTAIDAALAKDAAAASSVASSAGEASEVDGTTGDKTTQANTPNDAAATKTDRASKPTRSEHAKPAPKTNRALAAALAEAQPPAAGVQVVDALPASANHARAVDIQVPGSTAARFARAVERAAALTSGDGSGEAASAVTSAATAQGGGEQQTPGESTSDRTTEPVVAARQAASGGVAFTVTAPTSIDARMLAAVVDKATHADTAPGSIPERDVVAQLVQSMRLQFRDGIGEAVVKLRPDHLGSVQISIRIENGAIKATIQAEMPAVRQWLESHQDTLKSGLADQGLRLERFVVEPDAERQAAQEDAERHQQEQRRRQQRRMKSADDPVFEVLA